MIVKFGIWLFAGSVVVVGFALSYYLNIYFDSKVILAYIKARNSAPIIYS
jgi:hypothetical protein